MAIHKLTSTSCNLMYIPLSESGSCNLLFNSVVVKTGCSLSSILGYGTFKERLTSCKALRDF